MQAKVFTAAAALGVAMIAATSAYADERATKKAEVVTLDSGRVLIDESRATVLQQIKPVGVKAPTPASKREVIEIGIYSSDELAPKALAGVTDREDTTSLRMSRDGVLNTGRPVSATEGTVETVAETNIISLLPKDDEKAHAFGDTVNDGDLYYAQNGEVYQYIGVLGQ